MKRRINKKVLSLLMVFIILVATLSGCRKQEPKVITNIENTKDSTDTVKEDIEEKQEEPTEIVEKTEEKEEKENEEIEGKDNTEEEPKEEEKNKKGEESEKKDSEQNNEVKDEKEVKEDNVVIIDGVQYKNYKGPVQGEKKYKEGTPSYENSKEYKALGDIESPYKVDLRVTTDFGHKKVFAKNVGMIKDEVGMEVLFRNLDIQTAYGGSFVNAINGIESKYTFFTGKERKKIDWFYWINGILAPVGIGEYRPEPGDVIWWDYHDWSITMFIPAVVGSYPQPFKSGFQGKNPGTVILYTESYKKEAEELKKSLNSQGVNQVDIAEYNGSLLENPKKYYIVLGVWEDLVNSSVVTNYKGKSINLMEDINERNKLIGINSKFSDGKLHALDFKGKVVTSHSEGGAIFAYAAGIGSTKPVWIVTGTDDVGFKMAFNVLTKEPSKIKDTFGIVVSKSGIENVPYLK